MIFPRKKTLASSCFFSGKNHSNSQTFFETKLIVQIFKSYMQIKRACEKEKHPNTSMSFLCAWSHLHVFFPTTLGYRTFTKAHCLILFFLNKDSCDHAWTWGCPYILSFRPLNFNKQHATNSCFEKTSLPRYGFDVRYLLKVKNTM